MKKIMSIILAASFIVIPVAAQVYGEKNDTTEAWNDIKKGSKKALNKTGEFFKAAGADIKEGVNNMKEVKCLGTWTYKENGNSVTITVNDDSTMMVEIKQGLLDTTYYKGTYSNVLHSLTFTITEKGSKAWVVKAEEQEITNNTWYISYAAQDDKDKMKFTSTDIPADPLNIDFSKGKIFSKK